MAYLIFARLGMLNMTLTYRPSELIAWQEYKGSNSRMEGHFATLKSQFSPYQYFLLTLSQNGGEIMAQQAGNPQEFSQRLHQLSFGMAPFVSLITSKGDTLPLADYAHSRTFGAGKSTTLLFAFEVEKTEGLEWLTFSLDEFWD